MVAPAKIYLGAALWHLNDLMRASARFAEHRVMLLGAVGIACPPIFYLIWGYLYPQPYESLEWRIAMAVLALPLLLEAYLPPILRTYLPLYWLPYLTISLPFFTTYMMLMNAMSSVWLLSHLTATFLLFLLLDVRSSLLSLAVGTGLAVGLYASTLHPVIDFPRMGPLVVVWGFALIGALICNISGAIEWRSRRESLGAASATIAHELRTPLASIHLATTGLDKRLEELLRGYQAAVEAQLIVPALRRRAREDVATTSQAIAREAEHGLIIIDMLLAAAQQGEHRYMDHIDAADAVAAAIERYPYGSETERMRIHFEVGANFAFMGSSHLLTNVVFNLVKNAIHYTARTRGATIAVSVDCDGSRGYIVVHDTGQGVEASLLPQIFRPFVSGKGKPETALGIGLAFCRDAVRRMGGDIRCTSVEGEFTRFTLSFPVLPTPE